MWIKENINTPSSVSHTPNIKKLFKNFVKQMQTNGNRAFFQSFNPSVLVWDI